MERWKYSALFELENRMVSDSLHVSHGNDSEKYFRFCFFDTKFSFLVFHFGLKLERNVINAKFHCVGIMH